MGMGRAQHAINNWRRSNKNIQYLQNPLSPVDEGLDLLDDDAVLVPAEELQQPLNQLLEGDAAVTSHLTDGR